MPVSPTAAALTFVALAVLASGIGSWLIAIAKAVVTWRLIPNASATKVVAALQASGASTGLPLVPWSPRRSVPWAVVDLLALIGMYLIGSVAAAVILRGLEGTVITVGEVMFTFSSQQGLILVNVVVSLAILTVGLPLIALRTGATLRDFGWRPRELLSDLKLGLIGFVMLAPPVYALQGLLVSFWKESKHPLVEMFKETPYSGFFALLFFSAAVVAPLFEELVFRLLLQGFLEKAFSFRGETRELLFGGARQTVGEPPKQSTDSIQTEAIATTSRPLLLDNNPYSSPQITPALDNQIVPAAQIAEQKELRGVAAWLPIAVSSIIFALLHYSHGPDWIPLLLLAAGMGYLYQRTHRLLSSLIVHALLNGLSMWGLWVQVHDGLGATG